MILLAYWMEKYFSYLNFDYSALVSAFGFSLGPYVLFAILGFVFILLYGFSLGRTRAMISLLGIYIAYSIVSVFPYLDRLHDVISFSPELYITRAGLFLLFYMIVFMILNRSLVKNRLTLKDASFLMVSIISFLQLILLMTIISNIVPVSVLKLPDSLAWYFATNEALFYSFIAPVLTLLFLKGDRKY